MTIAALSNSIVAPQEEFTSGLGTTLAITYRHEYFELENPMMPI